MELDEIHAKLEANYAELAGLVTKLEMDKIDAAGLSRPAF